MTHTLDRIEYSGFFVSSNFTVDHFSEKWVFTVPAFLYLHNLVEQAPEE